MKQKTDEDRITIKILRKLSNSVDEYVVHPKSEYGSKQDFVEDAIREKLDQFRVLTLMHKNFHDNIIRLEEPKEKVFVEIFLKNKVAYCSKCDAKKCYHIAWCWQKSSLIKDFKNFGFKSPF